MGHLKARGVCSQGEGLHFGRGTKSLRCRLRRVFGRKRKSRRHEAAGRRNSPEAVPNGEGGMEAKNEMSRTRFCGKRKAQSTRDARSRMACWWTVDEEPRWHRIAGIASRDRQPEGRVLCRGSSRVEEKSEREKQRARRGLGGSISHGKLDISSVPRAPWLSRAAGESNPESNW